MIKIKELSKHLSFPEDDITVKATTISPLLM